MLSVISTVLIILAAIVLILVVLIQKPKGGGLASNFSAGNSIMGVRRSTDFLEKLTWGLAIGIMALTIISGAFYEGGNDGDAPESLIQENVDNNAGSTPAAPAMPEGGAQQQLPVEGEGQ
ncbi:MAG: preprotein translocase subunit SecG [Bacteroidetes bacterium]|nr:MAG: preprotein translocase subunit SecG [Bacteroidota bacterium]